MADDLRAKMRAVLPIDPDDGTIPVAYDGDTPGQRDIEDDPPQPVDSRWRAPWSLAQIETLNDWQHSGLVHPYTCGNDSSHPPLVAIASGWSCLGCDYTQNWAHAVGGVPVDTEETPA